MRRIAATIAIAFALAACSGGKLDRLSRLGGKKDKSDEEERKETPADSIAAKAASEEDALAFLADTCGKCHAKGAELHATWPMPEKKQLNIESLQAMDGIVAAYQSLINKAAKAPAEHRPSAMPPSDIDKDTRKRLEGVIYWFQLAMPSVVKEAEETYGASDRFASTLGVNLNFQCEGRSTTRDYAFRLFNQALGRLPNESEMKTLVPAKEAAKPVTDARRKKLATLVTTGDLKAEFVAYGLKLFAQRVGGAGSIKPNAAFGLDGATANDLKEEFYHLLSSEVENMSYRDILLLDRVKVSSLTFKYYNEPEFPCADPGPGAWGDCKLSPVRSNFFGTVGFLRSTPSSFLSSNNNYKRGGEIHAILRGERLMAQTDGPQGAPAKPMPTCLTSADERIAQSGDPNDPNSVVTLAPRGSLAIPRQGAVCQGCHLNKYLGVASYAFRAFDENGFLLKPEMLNLAEQNPYRDQVVTATDPTLVNGLPDGPKVPVDVELLKALLAEPSTGKAECITDRTGKKTVASIIDIGDLTTYMIGDGNVLVHGLARYIPSAISNLSVTNQEIIGALSRGWAEDEGKLLPVFRAYFESETFSCATGKED